MEPNLMLLPLGHADSPYARTAYMREDKYHFFFFFMYGISCLIEIPVYVLDI